MRVTAEFSVRRDDRNGRFYPKLTITSDITPEDESRLNHLLQGVSGVLRDAANGVESLTTDDEPVEIVR